MKRAERRHHLSRMKRKVRFIRVTCQNLPADWPFHKEADHIVSCSGPCCGNQRRWFGEKTVQERRTGL